MANSFAEVGLLPALTAAGAAARGFSDSDSLSVLWKEEGAHGTTVPRKVLSQSLKDSQ